MSSHEKRNLKLQIIVIPAIILIAVYLYYPIYQTLHSSLFDIRNFNYQEKKYIGLGNYKELFDDPIFWRALKNTTAMTAATIFIQLPIAYLLADALANHIRKRRPRLETLLLFLLFIPIALPTPVYAKSWRLFFSGSQGGIFPWVTQELGANTTIKQILGTRSVYLLGEPSVAIWVIIGVQTWARIGFNLLIYRSAILSIPVEIYESADMDGAGSWAKLFRITVPITRGIISVTIILAILGVFQLFDIVWLMTSKGGPLNTTHLLATYMYLRAFEDLRPGYGAAIAMTILVVAVSLSLIQRWVFRARE
jgi:raffinose/stachyose/melibiose transport system permease protein